MKRLELSHAALLPLLLTLHSCDARLLTSTPRPRQASLLQLDGDIFLTASSRWCVSVSEACEEAADALLTLAVAQLDPEWPGSACAPASADRSLALGADPLQPQDHHHARDREGAGPPRHLSHSLSDDLGAEAPQPSPLSESGKQGRLALRRATELASRLDCAKDAEDDHAAPVEKNMASRLVAGSARLGGWAARRTVRVTRRGTRTVWHTACCCCTSLSGVMDMMLDSSTKEFALGYMLGEAFGDLIYSFVDDVVTPLMQVTTRKLL